MFTDPDGLIAREIYTGLKTSLPQVWTGVSQDVPQVLAEAAPATIDATCQASQTVADLAVNGPPEVQATLAFAGAATLGPATVALGTEAIWYGTARLSYAAIKTLPSAVLPVVSQTVLNPKVQEATAKLIDGYYGGTIPSGADKYGWAGTISRYIRTYVFDK